MAEVRAPRREGRRRARSGGLCVLNALRASRRAKPPSVAPVPPRRPGRGPAGAAPPAAAAFGRAGERGVPVFTFLYHSECASPRSLPSTNAYRRSSTGHRTCRFVLDRRAGPPGSRVDSVRERRFCHQRAARAWRIKRGTMYSSSSSRSPASRQARAVWPPPTTQAACPRAPRARAPPRQARERCAHRAEGGAVPFVCRSALLPEG